MDLLPGFPKLSKIAELFPLSTGLCKILNIFLELKKEEKRNGPYLPQY
jgi:hypothetical protein